MTCGPTLVPRSVARTTTLERRPPWHHQPVRRPERRRRHRDLFHPPPPPGHRVQEVPGQDRLRGARRPRRARDLRQLRHPQAPDRQPVARRAPTVHQALHPDVLLMAQPGRTALRLRHRRPAPTLRPPQRPSTREGPARVGEGVEREPEAVRVDQDRRPDPRITGTTSLTIYWRRTLVAVAIALAFLLASLAALAAALVAWTTGATLAASVQR